MNTPGASLLEAEAVTVRFGARTVLSTASLRARAGLVLGLLGRNGSGKSTLLRCLVGDLVPWQGNLRLDGTAVGDARRASLAKRGVCFIPDRDLLHPHVSVRRQCEWVAAGCDSAHEVAPLLSTLGVDHVADRRPRTLSGGERRRAEVVFALLMHPRVLVLDEPLRGISPIDAEVILAALRAHAAAGAAVVLTGHELPLLLPALDAVTWCHQGRTTDFACTGDAMQNFAFRRDFLVGT